MFKSASLLEIFLRGGSCVKVLSVVSGNYLGAKLIALDPTSHRNRLSANLGLWRCSQVSPRQRLHQAVCSSQGFDLCHTLPSSPLSRTTFLSSQSSWRLRSLYSIWCSSVQSTAPAIWDIYWSGHSFCTSSPSLVSFPSPRLVHFDFLPSVLCLSSMLLFCLPPLWCRWPSASIPPCVTLFSSSLPYSCYSML